MKNSFKSKVFKAAWKIVRESEATMSEALRKAWAWAKNNVVEFVEVGRVVRETEKAVLAVVKEKFCHIRCEVVEVTGWVPKSLYNNGLVPSWFYNKNF